jgi:hypothetical protein
MMEVDDEIFHFDESLYVTGLSDIEIVDHEAYRTTAADLGLVVIACHVA